MIPSQSGCETFMGCLCLPVPGSQTFMEVAYGTRAGSVRHIVRHPENIGRAPQIFQSYNVHTCPILRVVLGEKHLISGKESSLCVSMCACVV